MSSLYRRFVLFLGIIILPILKIQATSVIEIDRDLQLIHLKDSVFIHVSWHELQEFGRFPSNGLLIVKEGQGILVDTPMDVSKTIRLTEYIEEHFQIRLVKFIATHYHDDCLGGLSYLQGRGIESIANSMTIEKCRDLDIPQPEHGFTDRHIMSLKDEKIECRYFGGGHTFDNIVVWLPDQKILFGGCLVRSADARNLGNTADAVLNEWGNTIMRAMENYRNIEVVVPGHGNSGGVELLKHTLNILNTNGY